MAWGFILAFAMWLLKCALGITSYVHLNVTLAVIAGTFGGIFPDIDRYERIGLEHRKTLHYPIGYLLLAFIAASAGGLSRSMWLSYASYFFMGAWIHSLMDIFDGYWRDPEKGVYEHITGRWIKPRGWIPYASLWEWVLQSLSNILAVGVSPHLYALFLPGWEIATLCFVIIWAISAIYEARMEAPRRMKIEAEIRRRMESAMSN